MAEDETRQRNTSNNNANVHEDRKTNDLKYLDFLNAAILYTVVCLAWLYECARDNSGSLKPGVLALESSIKFVVAPIYRKFHDAPFNLLQFLDRKVDESIQRMERVAKKASNQALSAAQKTPAAARAVVSEAASVARAVVNEPTAKELYAKYEPVAVQYAVLAWQVMRWIPVFRQMMHVALPTVKYVVKIYNWVVRRARRKGYRGARHMPVVPLERIAKVFSGKR